MKVYKCGIGAMPPPPKPVEFSWGNLLNTEGVFKSTDEVCGSTRLVALGVGVVLWVSDDGGTLSPASAPAWSKHTFVKVDATICFEIKENK